MPDSSHKPQQGRSPANRNALAELCRQKLQEAKQAANPLYPYSLQLAEWVLREHRESVPLPVPDSHWKLEQAIGEMYGWKDLAAADSLTNDDPSEDLPKIGTSLPQELSQKSPIELGSWLAQNLYANLSERMPSLQVTTTEG